MAKILLGATIGDARNAAGAIVYSKNQFGAYIRQKVSPVQPNTPRQTLVRQQFTTLSNRWANTITDAQRTAWRALAIANPVPDVFGNSQVLAGIQFYQRVNRNLQEGGIAILDAAPPDQNVIPLTSLSVAADSALQTVGISFTAAPLGATSFIIIFATPLLNPGRQFTKSFMRRIGATGLASASPIAAEVVWIAKYGALAAGQRLGIMVAVIESTNGAASPFMFADTIVT